jgi:hypothetical protein
MCKLVDGHARQSTVDRVHPDDEWVYIWEIATIR